MASHRRFSACRPRVLRPQGTPVGPAAACSVAVHGLDHRLQLAAPRLPGVVRPPQQRFAPVDQTPVSAQRVLFVERDEAARQ